MHTRQSGTATASATWHLKIHTQMKSANADRGQKLYNTMYICNAHIFCMNDSGGRTKQIRIHCNNAAAIGVVVGHAFD